MRHTTILRLLLVPALLVTCGCASNSNNKGKIEGTKWTSEPTTQDGTPMPAGWVKLEFGKDGSLVYWYGPTRKTGTYSLGSGDSVTMNVGQNVEDREKSVTITGDRLTWRATDELTIPFKRMK